MKKITTVGELKTFIQDLPDDMPIVHYQRDMERSGYLDNTCFAVRSMIKEQVSTYDRFDYIDYTYERYTTNKDGTPVLTID